MRIALGPFRPPQARSKGHLFPKHLLLCTAGVLGILYSWLAASVSPAHAANHFRSVITFGDSLTHNDILGAYYGNPQRLYGKDPMEAFFDKASKAGDELVSFAVAGSKSRELKAQIAAYLSAMKMEWIRKGTLFSIETGGNDLMDELHRLAQDPPGTRQSTDRIVTRVVSAIRSASATLYKTHPQARQILWTLPDLTMIPKYWGDFSPQEQQNIQAHISRANRAIRRMSHGSRVIILDLYTVLKEVSETPPEILGHPLLGPPSWGQYDCIFADRIHPTAVSNALIANKAIETVDLEWGKTIPPYSEEDLARLARIRKQSHWTGAPIEVFPETSSRYAGPGIKVLRAVSPQN